MTDTKTDGIFTLSKPVVMAFPNLFKPKPFMKNGKEVGEPKYSANFVFEPDSEELKALKTLAAKLAKTKWPDTDFKLIQFPFSNGDKLAAKREAKGKKDNEWMLGKVIVAARSKYEPRLSYIEKGKIIDLETELAKHAAKEKFYPGVEVLAQFNLVPNDADDEDLKGYITVYLNMVVSTGKGTKMTGARASGAEIFKGYVGAVSAEDPTAPGNDEDLSDLLN